MQMDRRPDYSVRLNCYRGQVGFYDFLIAVLTIRSGTD